MIHIQLVLNSVAFGDIMPPGIYSQNGLSIVDRSKSEEIVPANVSCVIKPLIDARRRGPILRSEQVARKNDCQTIRIARSFGYSNVLETWEARRKTWVRLNVLNITGGGLLTWIPQPLGPALLDVSRRNFCIAFNSTLFILIIRRKKCGHFRKKVQNQ